MGADMPEKGPFILDCDLHDYLEIACLFHYRVHLALKDAPPVTGTAMTTWVTAEHQEKLKIHTDEGILDIPLLHLRKMEVLTKDARFKEILF